MKNILIVTHSFPPLNKIASMRFNIIAKYFHCFDYNPIVITTNSTGDLKLYIDNNNIYRYGNNETVDISRRSKLSDSKIYNIYNYNKNIIKLKKKLYFNSTDRFSLFRKNFRSWEREVRTRFLDDFGRDQIDIVLSTFGPASTHRIGKFFSEHYQVPWVVDFRDLGALERYDKFAFIDRMDKAIERRILYTASAFTTVSPTLQRIIQSNYEKPTEVIYNGWDEDDREEDPSDVAQKAVQSVERGKYLYYAGTLYDFQIEGIEMIFQTLKMNNTQGISLAIRSLGPYHLTKEVVALVDKYALKSVVQILAPEVYNIVKYEESHSYCNLVFADLSREKRYTKGMLSGKFLKLLPKSPPILFVARPDNDAKEILERTKKGRLCSTIQEICSFFDEISHEPRKYPGNEQISDYSTRIQAKKLCSLFSGLSG